jgi:hypothetical protein
MSAMNTTRFCRVNLVGFVCLAMAGALSLAGQATPANLFKEVVDRKAKIVWANAPQNAIPMDVCTMLQVCAGAPDKLITTPPVTEAGKRVARGLFLSRSNDARKAEMVILARQTPSDYYFFVLAPDGTLLKTAYWATGKPWIQMGNALARPTFEKDKQIWLDRMAKLGAAPAAPAQPSQS